MFKNTKAFSGFSVDELQKAKQFYSQILGLEISESNDLLELQISGGTNILIYPKVNHTPATFTVLNFPVNNLEQTMDELINRGVHFEIYHEDNLKTNEKGVCLSDEGPKIAWFKDPAGNVLSVLEGK
ncbi:MAG: VOC family protein [Nitrososphaeraceae archaeon]